MNQIKVKLSRNETWNLINVLMSIDPKSPQLIMYSTPIQLMIKGYMMPLIQRLNSRYYTGIQNGKKYTLRLNEGECGALILVFNGSQQKDILDGMLISSIIDQIDRAYGTTFEIV